MMQNNILSNKQFYRLHDSIPMKSPIKVYFHSSLSNDNHNNLLQFLSSITLNDDYNVMITTIWLTQLISYVILKKIL